MINCINATWTKVRNVALSNVGIGHDVEYVKTNTRLSSMVQPRTEARTRVHTFT